MQERIAYGLMLGATASIVAIVYGLILLFSKTKKWDNGQENTDVHWFV